MSEPRRSRLWTLLRERWPMVIGVMTILATFHVLLWVSLANRVMARTEVRGPAGELRVCDSEIQPAKTLPVPLASTDPQARAVLEDFSVAVLVSSLQNAAAEGRTSLVEALVPRIQATGERGRRLARGALTEERRPSARAALERILQ